MRKLLLLSIVSICFFGWRSGDILQTLSALTSAATPAPAASPSIKTLTVTPGNSKQRAMSIEEYATLNKTDPAAYRKFLDSHQVKETNEVDKLMNFFSRGKYE